MSRDYVVENVNGTEVIYYEENGYRISFMANTDHPEYQRYLRWLNGEDEDGTLS